MKQAQLWGAGILVTLLAGYGVYALGGGGAEKPVEADLRIEAVVYYDPSCGCCSQHAAYLRRSGFFVDMQRSQSMDAVKEERGVPHNLMTCHTTMIEGYVVEGHMPLEAIDKLLDERPDIRGIALAGMPSGSPGMPGPKTERWIIYGIQHDGTSDVFMEI